MAPLLALTRRLRPDAPVDGASLAALRIGLGGVTAYALLRFVASGWVERLYGPPTFFFKPWLVEELGLAWLVATPPTDVLRAIYLGLGALALCVAGGVLFRVTAPLLAVGFLWVQCLDVTNYLNHTLLLALLLGMLALSPAHHTFSVDAWWAKRRGRPRSETTPALWVWLFRAQLLCVYSFAALAKLNSDWLLHAQPLGIWLRARVETPLFGPLFAQPYAPYLFSWGGFLFDLTIGWLLLSRRTRPFAYVVVVGFHLTTRVLFDIGVFPWIMIAATTVFFAPDWPRRVLAALGRARPAPPTGSAPELRRPRLAVVVVAAWLVVQIALPLRAWFYPGDVNWTEEGMRFSWRVMVREKNASLTYRVTDKDSGRRYEVSALDVLTWRQMQEIAPQPDLVWRLAQEVGARFRARGHDVEVRADVRCSLNGRPAAPLIDPDVNLLAVDDGLAPAGWILPRPDTPPAGVGWRSR